MLLKIYEDNALIGIIKYTPQGRVQIGGQTQKIRRLIADNKQKYFLTTLLKLPQLIQAPFRAVMVDRTINLKPTVKQPEALESSAESFVNDVFLGPTRYMGSSL